MPVAQDIPYTLADGKAYTARILPVAVSLEGLSEEEIQIVGHLTKVVHACTPLFARQNYDGILEIFAALEKMEKALEGEERKALAQYNTLFSVRNALWEYKGDQNFLFPLPKERARKEMSEAIVDALLNKAASPKGRALCPEDITEKEFAALGGEKNIVNSSVVRDQNGKLKVVLHEERYKKEITPMITALKSVAKMTTNETLKRYARAKIEQLMTGSAASRENADYHWLRLAGKIDFSISAGIETYVDRFKGVRGVAQAAVFLERSEYQELCRKVMAVLQELENNAPWNLKKQVKKKNMPQLRFVDVVCWSGFYETFPSVMVAQSLPNEKEFKDKHGSVNFVFANVQEAMGKWGVGNILKKEFFLDREMKIYSDHMTTAHLKLTAFHEIGHTMGGVAMQEEPSVYFGAEYPILEEARAELISLYMLPHLVNKGILKPEEETVGYYAMLLSILGNMRVKPVDHAGSRNMMFYYFLEKGAVYETEEQGKIKYGVRPERMREAAREMLETLGDIKAQGDKEGLKKFRDKYLSAARQQEFEKRLQNIPLGGGLIFPTLVQENDSYTGKVVYPESFREQPRTLSFFTKK